jgi:mannose-6-phosphate isomerase-like protein (cupin superfamily)
MLNVKRGGYCSIHYHEQRANRFFVVSGMIQVIALLGPNMSSVILTDSMQYDVPSMVPHMFGVYRDGIVIEDYWPDRGGRVASEDIVRLTEGDVITEPSNTSFINVVRQHMKELCNLQL